MNGPVVQGPEQEFATKLDQSRKQRLKKGPSPFINHKYESDVTSRRMTVEY
jgi:hypothetical protein